MLADRVMEYRRLLALVSDTAWTTEKDDLLDRLDVIWYAMTDAERAELDRG